jgi:hypothetical protein
MTLLEALTILEAAILECKKRDINTPEVKNALDLLERPYTAAARIVCDGKGNCQKEPRALTGTFYPLSIRVPHLYREPDCSGSIKVDLVGSQPIHFDFIIINRGKEIRSIQTDQGPVITGNLRQQ